MLQAVLLAHAPDEDEIAEQLAEPLREAGFEVAHRGTVVVGGSVVADASRLLGAGSPVILCGTVRALGTGWAQQIVHAARNASMCKVFCVRMERDAYVEALSMGEGIAEYWRDPDRAMAELLQALRLCYPLDGEITQASAQAELRYVGLALAAAEIIDLNNLPVNDPQVAAQPVESYRLYLPLRARPQPSGVNVVEGIEQQRRLLYAGTILEPHLVDRGLSVAQLVRENPRLVLLGDPGAGKSTVLRWLTTAYLLRYRGVDWRELPGTEVLPDVDFLPVLIRCREISGAVEAVRFEDVLRESLARLQLDTQDVERLLSMLTQRLKQGRALLLIDGIDEVTAPRSRRQFCRMLERLCTAHPKMHVVVTSRIVGYRELGFRLGQGFMHAAVSELDREDQDLFAANWAALTEPPNRQQAGAEYLLRALRSSPRIERLTSNPMLLTTLALVRRKLGKLPHRRAELYWETIQVLLHWRSEVEEPLDPHEAVPQLGYLAYVMGLRGEQQLREDEMVDALDAMRREYPSLHVVQARPSREFLRVLERQTGIVIEVGTRRHRGIPVPIFEFRHLSFQEYLAARALVDGRYPKRKRDRPLAAHVMGLIESQPPAAWNLSGGEASAWSWSETLRLCVACCGDDDVDEVILAVLGSTPETEPHRAVLAARCLADSMNTADATAEPVLDALALNLGRLPDEAAVVINELADSRWRDGLLRAFAMRFCQGPDTLRPGTWASMVAVVLPTIPKEAAALAAWVRRTTIGLRATAEADRITSALMLRISVPRIPALIDAELEALCEMPSRSRLEALAAAWTLNDLFAEDQERGLPLQLGSRIAALTPRWTDDPEVLSELIVLLRGVPPAALVLTKAVSHPAAKVRARALRALATVDYETATNLAADAVLYTDAEEEELAGLLVLASNPRPEHVDLALDRCLHPNPQIQDAATHFLTTVGGDVAVNALVAILGLEGGEIRELAARALGKIRSPRATEPLLAALGSAPWNVTAAVIEALGSIGSPRALEALAEQLASHDVGSALAAFEALASGENIANSMQALEARLKQGTIESTGLFTELLNLAAQRGVADAERLLLMLPTEIHENRASTSIREPFTELTTLVAAAPEYSVVSSSSKVLESRVVRAEPTQLTTPRIKVVGVGGGGKNAVTHLLEVAKSDLEFITVDTGAQVLRNGVSPTHIQIVQKSSDQVDPQTTADGGLGDVFEGMDLIENALVGADLVFVLAGLGGSTGSIVAPVIASSAHCMGALTIALVTTPFGFEGPKRMAQAQTALAEMKYSADSMIVVPNERVASQIQFGARFVDIQRSSYEVLQRVIGSIADLVRVTGEVFVDFSHVQLALRNRGEALIGIGRGNGSNRATEAALDALSSPLISGIPFRGATSVLLNVTGGMDLQIDEVTTISSIVVEAVGDDAEIIFGAVHDSTLTDEVRVTMIVTGLPKLTDNAAFTSLNPVSTRYVGTPADMEIPTFLRRMKEWGHN